MGNMVIAWSAAEHYLKNLLGIITQTDHEITAAIYYRVSMFESRIKMIRALLQRWETDDYDVESIDKCIGKLSALSPARNRWIHGDYYVSFCFSRLATHDWREEAESPRRRQLVKAHDIRLHSETVRKRCLELSALTRKPWRTKPPSSGGDHNRHQGNQDNTHEKPKSPPQSSKARVRSQSKSVRPVDGENCS